MSSQGLLGESATPDPNPRTPPAPSASLCCSKTPPIWLLLPLTDYISQGAAAVLVWNNAMSSGKHAQIKSDEHGHVYGPFNVFLLQVERVDFV